MDHLLVFEEKDGQLQVKATATEKDLRIRYFLEKEWQRELLAENEQLTDKLLLAENQIKRYEVIINMLLIENAIRGRPNCLNRNFCYQ